MKPNAARFQDAADEDDDDEEEDEEEEEGGVAPGQQQIPAARVVHAVRTSATAPRQDTSVATLPPTSGGKVKVVRQWSARPPAAVAGAA